MRKTLLATAVIAASLGTGAFAAVELNTYADGEGYLDVQALTCAQLADTFQEDANYLTAWYSGWYNGLAKKHFANIPRSKEAEHETIVYCKAHPGDEKVIKVLGRIIDDYREKRASKFIGNAFSSVTRPELEAKERGLFRVDNGRVEAPNLVAKGSRLTRPPSRRPPTMWPDPPHAEGMSPAWSSEGARMLNSKPRACIRTVLIGPMTPKLCSSTRAFGPSPRS